MRYRLENLARGSLPASGGADREVPTAPRPTEARSGEDRPRPLACPIHFSVPDMSRQPLGHGHHSSFARGRLDIEVVHEPSGARQTDPQAVAARIPILHRERHIGDPRPAVAGGNEEALASIHRLELDLTLARVVQYVPSDFRNRRRYTRHVTS